MPRLVVPVVLVGLSAAALLAGVDAAPDPSSILLDWYQSVGTPQPDESFGAFLSRVAQSRLDTPYREAVDTDGGEETVPLGLDHFECVSFLESSLAVARCAWRGEPSHGCFVWELVGLRYRSGIMSGYPSRLHYFVDWLEDNEGRWRLNDVTSELGGRPLQREFFYLTRHDARSPALAPPGVRRMMLAIEANLSSRPHSVLGRDAIRDVSDALQDGDLIAVAGDKPGRLVTHAGLITRRAGERARLLHASSHRHRVVATKESLADYVLRRPERIGVIVARPLPPLPAGTPRFVQGN